MTEKSNYARSNFGDATAALKRKLENGKRSYPGRGIVMPAGFASECETCGGQGFLNRRDEHTNTIVQFVDEFGQAIPCPDCEAGQRMLAKRWGKIKEKSDMPTAFEQMTLDSFFNLTAPEMDEKRLAIAAADAFVSHGATVTPRQVYDTLGSDAPKADDVPRWGLAIYSPRFGVGKSALVAAICNEMVRRGMVSVFMSASQIVSEVRRGYDNSATRQEKDFLNRLKQVPLLAIDEMRYTQSEDVNRIFRDIINERYIKRLPLLITTNDTMDGFDAYWGNYISSRVNALCLWIEMGGVVLRREDPPMWNPELEP